jgi:cell division protein ZapB
MAPNNEIGQDKNEGGNKKMIFIVIVFLLLANAVLLWQFFNKKSENQVLTENNMALTTSKDSISAEYTAVKGELSKLQADNVDLQGKLAANDEEIAAQKAKIEKMMRSSADAGKLRAEINKLKDMKTQYESRINELVEQNKQLTNQNQELNTNLSSEKGKNENLSKENTGLSNKVALGSIMKADNVVLSGVKFKSSGKEVDEKKAKNVQKIKACFNLNENLVVDKGTKSVYIRVMGPDKSVLSTTSATFTFNGQQLPYTIKQDINYDNKKVSQCVFWEKGSVFAKGIYAAEFYCEGNKIGEGALELK